jgi:hypothetical protein
METLENIPVHLDAAIIQKALRLDSLSETNDLIETAQPLVRGRAVYRTCYVESRLGDAVILDGSRFTSRVLRTNLESVERAFLYVVTIGHDLEEAMASCDDLLRQYYLDVVGNVAVSNARAFLEKHLIKRFGLSTVSKMSPGSLADWPIQEQRPLFGTIGDVEGSIGVHLTKSCLMIPRKSVSGIYFPTEVPFLSCQLCPRRDCPGRQAPYDQALEERYRTPP